MCKNYLFTKLLTLICVASNVYAIHATDTCDAFVSSKEVMEILQYLPKTSKIWPPAWYQYDAGMQDYVLQSVKTQPGCIIPIHKGKILSPVQLSKPVKQNENNQFSLYQVDSILCASWANCALSAEFDGVMRKIGIDTAIVYNADSRLVAAHKWKEYEINAHGMANYDSEAIVHEGFHVLGEILPYIDNRNPALKWPAWAKPHGRHDIEKRCYKPNLKTEAAFKAEANAMILAVQLAATGSNAYAKAAAIDFLKLRTARRSLLSSTIAPNATESELSYCNHSEAAMEMIEGVANWVGDSVDLANGVIRPEQIVSLLNFTLDKMSYEYFYWFGEYQIYLLWKLFPEDFQKVTLSLVNSSSPMLGVEEHLRKQLNFTPLSN